MYRDITRDAETSFEASNYKLQRPLHKGKYKKVIGLMKDELGGKTMIEFVGLGAKTYSLLIVGSSKDKKAKGTKKYVIKRKLKFDNYKNRLEATQFDN